MAAKLTDITTQYHTFEDNQVLTAKQLNEFIDYFEDQDRLSRIFLSGVGIVCGFELKYDSLKPSVTISQGAGVTTDGDLIKLQQNSKLPGLKSIDLTEIEYTKYKVFEDSFGNYSFFKRLVMVDGNVTEVPIEMFELLPESAEDAIPLNLFSSLKNSLVSRFKKSSLSDLKNNSVFRLDDNSGSGLESKVVLLYLESYEKKADLCTSIDCDNQGIEQVARLRVLLVSKTDAAFIAGKDPVYTKHNIAGSIFELPEVAVRRVVLNKLNSADYNELKRAYFLALTSDSLIDNLSDGISKVAANFKSLLKLEITDETLQTTITGLKNLIGKSAYNMPFNVQYRYDCIKDIADTYNELKCNLTELKEECCPDIKSFPKHLMLGQLDEINNLEKHFRHSFYKSPILNCGTSKIQQCRSLATRIFQLINQFQTPVGEIKITPSNKLPELSFRSIPFYYNVQDELLASWNFNKTEKNRQDTNLSYHITNLSPAPHIQNPLNFNIDRFDFYRIEGHQGKVYQDVLAELDNLKTQYGLAFDVKALSVNINTENLNVDDYQCEFEDLNVLLRAWTAEQECTLAEVSGFFSGFSTAVPGTNVKEPQLDLKRAVSNEFLTNTADIKSEKSSIISKAEVGRAASKTVASQSATYTKSNVIPDNLTIKENALGNVMKVALDETVGGSVNDIIAKANFLVADKVNTEIWKNEPEIKALVIDQSIELMAYTHILSQRMPTALIDVNPARITSYKLTMDDLCARVKKLKTSYQTTKLSTEMKAFMGILINQLANICCSGKKLQILLEEVDKRKQDILVRLQLSIFVEKNPGLEHKAGVQPGGTFILVYLNKLPALKPNITDKLSAINDLSLLSAATKERLSSNTGLNIEKLSKVNTNVNIENLTKADINLDFNKLSELDISTILQERLSILNRIIRPVELPDNTVVADFSLPYMCCSDCAPVNFIIQKPPVSLRLEKDEFCLGKDTSPLIFDVSPVDGVIKVEPAVVGVSVDGVKLFIDTETFPDEMLGKAIHFTVNNQITQATIRVYRTVQFDFEVPESPTALTKITFIPSGDLDGATFSWNFGDSSSLSTERNPTHQYKLPVNKENKVTVSLTVIAPNGVCHNTVTHDISFKIEDTKINLEKLTYCSNDKNTYPFIITPPGAEAKIAGNGVEQDANGKFVFVPANAPVGETSFTLNGSSSGLKVTVIEAPVAKFTPSQVGNQLILTNNSTGAVSFTWLINGNKFETSDSKPFVIDLTPNSPNEWTLVLSAISETCGTNTSKEIRVTTKFEKIELRLEKDKFCIGEDKSPLIFEVLPVDGEIKVDPEVKGVTVDGVKLFIDTETFPNEMLGKAVQFTVNGQIVQTTLTVYRGVQFTFDVPESPTTETTIKFVPGGDIDGATFEWDFGDGSDVSTEQNPTHQYKLPVNEENKVTVSLTVTASNGVCHSTVKKDITFKREETKINLDKLTYCSNDKTQYPFIITPAGAEAQIAGNGVIKDTSGNFVFSPVNALIGETIFTLNGSPSGLKVTVNEAPVAKFTPSQVGNQLILTNNSTGAVSFTWLINGNKFETSDSKPFVIDLTPNSPNEWTLILSANSETCGTNTSKEIRFTTKIEEPVNTCIDDVKGLIVSDAKLLTKLEMPNSDLVQEIWDNTSALYGGTTQFDKGVLNDIDNFLNGNNNERLVNLFIELMQATVNRIVEIDRIKRPEEFAALVQLFILQLQLFYNILGCQDPETIRKFTEIIQAVLNQIIGMLQLLKEFKVSMPESLRSFIKAYGVRISKIGLLTEHLTKINDENLI